MDVTTFMCTDNTFKEFSWKEKHWWWFPLPNEVVFQWSQESWTMDELRKNSTSGNQWTWGGEVDNDEQEEVEHWMNNLGKNMEVGLLNVL
jgi:hypothetical protein